MTDLPLVKKLPIYFDAVGKSVELRDGMGHPPLEGVDPARLAEVSGPPGKGAIGGHDPVETSEVLPVPLGTRSHDHGIVGPEVVDVNLVSDVGHDMKALEILLGENPEIPRRMDCPIERSVVLVNPKVDDDVLPVHLSNWLKLDRAEHLTSPLVVPPGPLEVPVKDVVVWGPDAVKDVVLVGDHGRSPIDAPAIEARRASDHVILGKAGEEAQVVRLSKEPCGDILKEMVPEASLIFDLNSHAR